MRAIFAQYSQRHRSRGTWPIEAYSLRRWSWPASRCARASSCRSISAEVNIAADVTTSSSAAAHDSQYGRASSSATLEISWSRKSFHVVVPESMTAMVIPNARCCQGASKTSSPFDRGGAADPAASSSSNVFTRPALRPELPRSSRHESPAKRVRPRPFRLCRQASSATRSTVPPPSCPTLAQ